MAGEARPSTRNCGSILCRAESAEELLQSLLGNDPSLQPLKQLLITRTEGNPFFLEESVRTLVETKVLEGERGIIAWRNPLRVFRCPRPFKQCWRRASIGCR